MKKQKENSHEGITWSEMGKQNVQAEKVYCHEKLRTVKWTQTLSCLIVLGEIKQFWKFLV